MTHIVYTGPHTAVTLADGTVAANGEHTEVSDDLAERYLGREDFQAASSELASFTHDELDAFAEDVDDYPKSGTKDEKVAALSDADLTELPEPTDDAGDGEED